MPTLLHPNSFARLLLTLSPIIRRSSVISIIMKSRGGTGMARSVPDHSSASGVEAQEVKPDLPRIFDWSDAMAAAKRSLRDGARQPGSAVMA
jgi:hypothetical protein